MIDSQKNIRWPTRTGVYNMEMLEAGIARLPAILKQFGYQSLRPGQEVAVTHMLGCRDVFCIMPTASGKTFTFVAPILAHNWRAVVFSPLVSLMRDQVTNLWKRGVAARSLSGMNAPSENAESLKSWADGSAQILFIAPERLRNAEFLRVMEARPPDVVVVDEAHVLSQWGVNFRSSYCQIGDFVSKFDPIVVAAFTATAPAGTEKDVRDVLGIGAAARVFYYPRRENISLHVDKYTGDNDLVEMVNSLPGSGIIYCSTIKKTEFLAKTLSGYCEKEVGMFHGQMPPKTKQMMQEEFMSGQIQIMVATCAFGMGIDKSDIRFVIHRDLPGSVEAYVQEFGRGGRDGNPSQAILLYDPDSVRTQQFLLECGHPDIKEIAAVYRVLEASAKPGSFVLKTRKEVAEESGVNFMAVDAVYEILTAAGILEVDDTPSSEKPVGVIIEDYDKAAQDKYLSALIEYYHSKDAFTGPKCDLAAAAGCSWATLDKTFKAYEKLGIISVERAFRGKPVRVVNNLGRLDKDILNKRKEIAFRGLEQMLTYCQIPAGERHEYLETALLGNIGN